MTLKALNPYLLLIIVLVAIMAFWRVGVADLEDWDEARNGVNAYEMYHNHNYFNLYYDGLPDTWNAKPPLMTWLIVLSYRLFGFNEFALRLPSVLSTIVFFLFFFKLVGKYEGQIKAFLCCLVLLSCKAILGQHVGITGDYDALLLCLLTLSAYYFTLYIDFDRPYAIYLTGICTALAFYTKGTAAFIYVPGFVLYALHRKKLMTLVKAPQTWLAFLLFAGIVATWVATTLLFGQYATHSYYGSKNAVETMLFHDTFRRLTSTDFEQTYVPDHFFALSTLDSRLNIWNYLLSISILTGLVLLYRNRSNLKGFIERPSNRFTVFSICMAAPLILVLSVATNAHPWYMAPAMGFIVFVMVKGMLDLAARWRPLLAILGCVFLFTFIRHIVYLDSRSRDLHNMFSKRAEWFKDCKQVVSDQQPAQRILLYLEWLNVPIIKHPRLVLSDTDKRTVLILTKEKADALPPAHVKKVGCYDDRYVMVVQ